MLRKFLFLIILWVAFQQISFSAHFYTSTTICKKEIVGSLGLPSIHESYLQLTDFYWEEDELDRYNWEKISVKQESNSQQNFSIANSAVELPNAHTHTSSDFLPIPIYLYNSNLRI